MICMFCCLITIPVGSRAFKFILLQPWLNSMPWFNSPCPPAFLLEHPAKQGLCQLTSSALCSQAITTSVSAARATCPSPCPPCSCTWRSRTMFLMLGQVECTWGVVWLWPNWDPEALFQPGGCFPVAPLIPCQDGPRVGASILSHPCFHQKHVDACAVTAAGSHMD